ncbi:MAG: protein kinase [Acidobacteriota bacterium]
MNEQEQLTRKLAPSKMIGHYAVIDQLGRGGMGEVFVARDTKLDRKVALKVLAHEVTADAERLQRFQREAKMLAALNHPNIVTIFSVEEAEELHLLVMELVEGKTLRQVIPRGGLPLAKFFDIALPLAEALSAAHERGITHRDLKPENVMVTDSGRVKVLDFGLAKVSHGHAYSESTHESSTKAVTQLGVILGTVPYMSPEQAQGKPVDHRSDIFSLGIVLYEMLAGERPFKGETVSDLIASILRDTPGSVSSLRTGVPRELGRIVRHCLEKNPQDRIQSALDLHIQLKGLWKDLELERAITSGKRRYSTTRRRPLIPVNLFGWLVNTRWGLTALLAGVLAFNYLETSTETALKASYGWGMDLGYHLARSAHWFEWMFSFDRHDVTNTLAVYGYSISYFMLFPVLVILVGLALARREDLAPYRVFAIAISLTYAVSLPFFLLFPVPERWSFPDAEAVLLSDLWTSKLIEMFRPISGLDNCFPSFHVATTVDMVLASYLFRLRTRSTVLILGLTIILSTFVLGIHWLVDIVAGVATGVISIAIAMRADRSLERPIGSAGSGALAESQQSA